MKRKEDGNKTKGEDERDGKQDGKKTKREMREGKSERRRRREKEGKGGVGEGEKWKRPPSFLPSPKSQVPTLFLQPPSIAAPGSPSTSLLTTWSLTATTTPSSTSRTTERPARTPPPSQSSAAAGSGRNGQRIRDRRRKEGLSGKGCPTLPGSLPIRGASPL